MNRQLFGYYTCRPVQRVSAENSLDGGLNRIPGPFELILGRRHEMPASWTVLGSGSGGNASLLELDGSGLLVDIGLGPRQLASRLRAVGFGWESIRGVVLTHTHSDHWSPRSLAKLAELRIPFYCHAEHLRPLNLASREFQTLQFGRLVKTYSAGMAFTPLSKTLCRAMPLAHDGGATFGFRIQSDQNSDARPWSVGYVADLGSWEPSLPRDAGQRRRTGRGIQPRRRDATFERPRCLADPARAGGFRASVERPRGSPLGGVREAFGPRSSQARHPTAPQPRLQPAATGRCRGREVIARHRLDVALHTARQEVPGPRICLGEDYYQVSSQVAS